ncbi:hypothetical protein ACK8HX_07805 [Oryzobacter sp. R7]|uniref:hypothetical protein n=1 Tax=Oryzobacter faecalis TaxID=3388656 RepID=UPI00398CCEBC
MTTLEDDRRDFTVARWPDLEAVALLVVPDPEVARRVTTDALAGVVGRWRDAVDAGRPAGDARRALLRGAVAAGGDEPPGSAVAGADGDEDDPDEDDAGEAVVAALLRTLRDEDPVDRALVAARLAWDAGPEEVAALLDLPTAGMVARDAAVRSRLTAAQDAAREAVGLGPAPWLLEDDLRGVLALVLRSQPDPPDPATLVAHRAGGLRRRRLLVGGAATLAVAGAGWWVVGATRAAPSPTPTALRPDDPAWDTTRRWPARGRYAGSSDAQALVIRDAPQGSRLLYADVVGDRTVVVASPADISGRDGVRLVVWTGPRGAPLDTLRQVSLARDGLSGVRDVVALVVAQDVGDALLVVAPPRLEEAAYAAVATPTPAGGWVRTFATLELAEGVGVELVGRGLGPATWVSAGGYQGTPAGTPSVRPELLPNPSPDDYARDRRLAVAELTGIPDGLLSTRVVADTAVDAVALDPGAIGTTGRVVVVQTRTPDDAVVRSVRLTTRSPGGTTSTDLEDMAVVAAADSGGPTVLRLPARGRPERFLVVAPGAARVRLLSSAPGERPVTRFVRCTGSSAVLSVPDSRQEAAYRLLAVDAGGRETYRGAATTASELV